MILLLIKTFNSYNLVSPDTFGMETWGTNTQKSIIKKNKCWFEQYWKAGNDWFDDYESEYKLNVVLETESFKDILHYLHLHRANCLYDILDEYKHIVDDYVDFNKWCSKGVNK